MLIQSSGTCDICGSSSLPFTDQESSVICKRCNKKFKACSKCKSTKCPDCKGKLESQMDWAAKNNIFF